MTSPLKIMNSIIMEQKLKYLSKLILWKKAQNTALGSTYKGSKKINDISESFELVSGSF